MKYLRVELTNWGPHKHRVFDIDPNAQVIAIAGENDKGKSWIIRALAGVFITGKNEYFDKFAIHDGEEEAEIKIDFLDNLGKHHQVHRILRKKEADGNDEIHLNGQLISPTEYNVFLSELFQTPDPKMLLSLATSMQGETHFYLKANRREREEAMRTLTQLDRVDTWKEHLTRLINTQDKNLAEKRNNLNGQKTTLLTSLKATEEKIQTLEKEIQELKNGTSPEGKTWSLENQSKAVSSWTKNKEDIQRLETEIQNLQANKSLLEESIGKAEEEKKSSPLKNLDPEAIQKKEDDLTTEEANLREARIWKKLEIKETHSQNTEKDIQTQEEILKNSIPPLNPEEEEKIKNQLDETKLAGRTLQLLTKPHKELSQIEEEITKILPLEEEAKHREQTLLGKEQNFKNALRLLHACVEDLGIDPKKKSPNQISEEILNLIQKLKIKISSKKISSSEANLLQQRVLSNWEDNTENPCPICGENLTEKEGWRTVEERKATLLHLQTELTATQEEPELPGGQELKTLIALERILKSDIPEIQTAEKELITLKETLRNLSSSKKLDEEKQTLLKELTAAKNYAAALKKEQEEIQKLQALVTKGIGETPLEKATHLLKSCTEIKEKNAELRQGLQTKKELLANLQKEISETRKELPEEKKPQVKILTFEEEEKLREEYIRVSKELESLRKERNKLTPILNKIREGAKKIQELNNTLETKENSLKSAKAKSLWDFGATPFQINQSEEDTAKECLSKQKRLQEVETLLKEEKPKVKETAEKVQETDKQIAEIDRQGADIEAAQEVEAFLDYKNAPRKLLSRTIDQIFHRANKLSRGFNLGMVLAQGKNLEFNVIQLRNGKEITQKTERLGFGKANILGITTRLAAQDILAPTTGFLILDEPSPHVDTLRKNALREFLTKLSETKDGATQTTQIILVEHEESIAQAANQIIWIN